MKYLNIKQKLILMVVLIILPMIILQTVLITKQIKQSIDAELQFNLEYAQTVNAAAMNFIESIWDTEFSIGSAISQQKNMSIKMQEKYMADIVQSQSTVLQYLWADSHGTVLADSNGKASGLDISYRDYYRKIVSGEDKVISDLIHTQTTNADNIIIVRGIRSEGELIGMVIGIIDIKKLETVLPSDRAKDSSSFGLVDSKGYYIYLHGVSDIQTRRIKINDQSPAAKALRGESILSNRYRSPINSDYNMGAAVPISKIGWAAIASTSLTELLNKTIRDMRRDIIILFIVIMICIMIAFRMSQDILQPIYRLRSSAQEISNGNLNVHVNIKGDDELAAAGQAFDHMVKYINEYDKLKTHFFSTLSHELKTPLNIILSSVQMLEQLRKKNSPLVVADKMEKYSCMMRQNCYRLLRLINNLIDITKIDSGFFKLNVGNYNIVSIVEEITLSVAQYAEDKGINVIFDTDTEEKTIACDPDKLERIILNLLSNAIKFTKPNGQIIVNLEDKKDYVVVSVKDTGIGIPEDKQHIIFERFKQVDNLLQKEHEGSGIGLSLAKSLVEAHDGKISLESKVGVGSEFKIELPVKTIQIESSMQAQYTKEQVCDRVQKINIEFSDIYTSLC